MRMLRVIAAGGIFQVAAAAQVEPALPVWHLKERAELEATGWIPGALLLTGETVPDASEQALEALPMEAPKPEEIADDPAPMIAIEEKFLAAYFAERPKNFLVDPQGLLSAAESRDRLGFLNYHASDSSIDLFVYVIGGNQEIPGEVRDEELIERFFSEGRPAAVVFYYFGAPQRSVVYLSPSLTDSVAAAEQRRTLESCVIQASEKSQPAEQIETFLVQMSIRLYWLEHLLGGESTGGEPAATAVPVAAVSGRAAAKSEKFRQLLDLIHRSAVPGGALLGGLLTVFGFNRWLRHRARYRFPEFDVEPRLGGTHAAGIGAVISFASAALPPASQRDQVPDYLRRA